QRCAEDGEDGFGGVALDDGDALAGFRHRRDAFGLGEQLRVRIATPVVGDDGLVVGILGRHAFDEFTKRTHAKAPPCSNRPAKPCVAMASASSCAPRSEPKGSRRAGWM